MVTFPDRYIRYGFHVMRRPNLTTLLASWTQRPVAPYLQPSYTIPDPLKIEKVLFLGKFPTVRKGDDQRLL